MEASAVPMDCDVEKEMEEDEDLEFFQKSIKVHDRFGGNCEEEDEFYSDDDEPDEPTSCQKGGYLKPVGGFSRNVLSSETKLETISMLDNARSSCSKSGHDLSLGMLNLKSDEVGLGDLDGRAFLGKSILGSSPPFGDPLSEMDILDSALSLLDDKTCEKFREKGLFDGLVDKNGRIIDNEMMMANENYICDVEAKLDVVSSYDKLTPEPFRSICDSPKNLGRPAYDFTREDVSKPDVHPSTTAEPLGPLLSSQLKKTRQSKSVNSSRKQLNDSDSVDSKGSIGREYPPNNLSLDDLVRYINGESLKKVCNRKPSTPSSSTLPPQTNTANTKKMKKQPVNKHDVATTSKGKVPPAASRVRKTTKKSIHVGTEEFTKDSPQEAFFDVDNTTAAAGSTTTNVVTASAKGAPSTCNAEHDDENAGQEEFIAVLHKRRVKTRKEPLISRDMYPACVVSPQTKVAGRQPEKTSGRIDRDLGASSLSVFSVSSKSYRSDTSGGSLTSKRGSLSSLDESPPLATYEPSALGASARDEDHAGAPYYRPSFSKFSAGSSYASALLQNMPKFSVTGSRDVSQTEPGIVVGSARFSSPLNSEAENEMLLSPPQSEADTGFSSSSSLSPDDAHVSLTSDSTLTTSKGNEAVDSESMCHPVESMCHPLESRSHPLESRSYPLNEDSSTLMQTSDGDVRSDDFEQKVEECVVRDSVSCDISDLDFPLKTHISGLPERTDKVQHHHHNAGESSLACSCRESSCAAATQSKNSPVIFDTRIRAVTRRMSNADIVFLFDADDSGADTMSDVVNYVAVDDIDGITFTSSPDSTPLDTGALEKASILSRVEASDGTKTIVECYGFEVTDKLDVECQLEIQVTDDKGRCDECVLQRDSEYGNAVSGDDGRSVERRMSSDGKTAVRSAPRGSFDLLAAQKFFSQAFKSVLKREHECPGQVVRL